MKNLIKFIIFVIYCTSIFFFPNNQYILVIVFINCIAIIFKSKFILKIFEYTVNVLPFVLFTFIINCLLDNFFSALWIGIKLILVCNITIIYSTSTSVMRNS